MISSNGPSTILPDLKGLSGPSSLEVASESIVVRIRWFGLILGAIVANLPGHDWQSQATLDAILLWDWSTHSSILGIVGLARFFR